MKLKAPAFSLKKSVQGVLRFSESGNLLAQVTSRVVIWNVSERKQLYSAKVLSNEHFVAFHEQTQRIAIKNSNGELAFVDLKDGHVISQTGKFEEFRMGCQPWFVECGSYLVDGGGSGGALMVWDVSDATPSRNIDLGCASVSDIVYSARGNLFACLCGRLGGIFVALVAGDLSSHNIIKLTATRLGVDPAEWWEAAHLAVSPCGSRLAFVAKTQARENRSRLFVLDLQSLELVNSVAVGDDSHGWATSLSWSHDGHLALVYRENPWRQGMSTAQYEAVKSARDWESVHILEAATGRLVQKVYIPGVNRAVFQPGSGGLALNCTLFPGAFLSGFGDLSDFAVGKRPKAARS